MSIKDTFAFWKNKDSEVNTKKVPSPTAPKAAFTFKQTTSETEKLVTQTFNKVPAVTTPNKWVIESSPISKPSEVKKELPSVKPPVITSSVPVVISSSTFNKWGIESSPIAKPSEAKKELPIIKPPVITSSVPVVISSSTFQQEIFLKPSEVRKRMAAGQSLYSTAPVITSAQRFSTTKPITQVIYQTNVSSDTNTNSGTKGSFDIVKDVPMGSVKQNARKLNQFYMNQALMQAKKAEELKNAGNEPTQTNQTHQESTEQAQGHQQPKQELHQQKNIKTVHEPQQNQGAIKFEQSGNITVNYQPTFTPQVSENKEKPQQIQHNTNYDLGALLRSKKKMTKPKFDSDED